MRQRWALGLLIPAVLMSGHAANGTVVIAAFQYAPEVLTVAPGDTVTWDNEDVFIHTVTADSGAWTSPELRRGQRYVFVPSDTGRFSYHCSAHAIMHGVLVVQR